MRTMLSFSEKEDVFKYVSENNIKILNLCHIPNEGRLKALSFSATDKDRVLDILEFGERVDGSSLFPSIEPGKSDIYIKPNLNRAFVNSFSVLPTLNILCSYLADNGKPLDIASQTIMARAEDQLRNSSGISLRALVELEFYIIAKQRSDVLFQGDPDRNYHEVSPFTLFEDVRNEILATLTSIGIPTKYGHSEVGRITCKDGTVMEQHEIELAPQSLAEMSQSTAVSKWLIRNVCMRRGVAVSFIPKIDLNHAGNGMHVHLCGLRKDRNVVVDADGNLSEEALQMIGGILKLASSLSAFGNPTPVSYLRFISPKESPMHICWSARNRLALIRIPLWWTFKRGTDRTESCRQTFEYRAPDAFANPDLLFAALAVAVNWGWEHSKESLAIADNLNAKSIDEEEKRFKMLPKSCGEAADELGRSRKQYEAHDVFPERLVENTIQKLNDFKDRDLWRTITGKPEEMQEVVNRYLHYR